MEKVLLTGSDGFIASHVSDELKRRGYTVIPFDNYSNIEQDIRNPRMVEAYMENADYCLHMAACPYIPFGYSHPNEFFETNANGTQNVLNAAKKTGTRVIYTSTSEVYGTAEDPNLPMSETHRINPHSTYAVAKYAGDGLCRTYHHEHRVDVTVVRMFNNFGPKETWRYVIPEIIEQLSRGPVLSLGNVYSERDFTYVVDGARALVDVMECSELDGEVVNCGTGETWSILTIAEMLGEIMRPGEDVKIKIDEKRLRPFDVDRLICDASKLRQYTGWEPKVCFRDGLERTVEWFKGNGGKWDFREMNKMNENRGGYK